MKLFKRTLYLVGGICWLLFGVGFGMFVFQFLGQGMGWEFAGTEWIIAPALLSANLVTGLACAVGLLTAVAVCWVVSFSLFARAFRPVPAEQ